MKSFLTPDDQTLSISDAYQDLVALTRSYLSENFSPEKRFFADSSDYQYFLNLAKQQQLPKLNPTQKNPAPPSFSPPINQTPAVPPTPIPSKPIIAAPPIIENKPLSLPVTHPEQKQIPAPNLQFIPEESGNKEKSNGSDIGFDSLRKTVLGCYPKMVFLDTIPDDAQAKRLSMKWKQDKEPPQVLILSFESEEKHHKFLSNLANAIQIVLNVQVLVLKVEEIEKTNSWDKYYHPDLKLVLAERSQFKHSQHFKNTPSILLENTSLYLTDPSLKSILWNKIQQFFA